MKIQDLIKVMWQGNLVITTKQLAQAYGVTTMCIKENFRRAKKQFTQGEDYYQLKGEELRQFKEEVYEADLFNVTENRAIFYGSAQQITEGDASPISVICKTANTVYIWTYKGCVRHCKMINTPEAWDMFNELARVYFGVVEEMEETPLEIIQAPPNEDLAKSFRRLQNQFARPCRNLAVVYILLMSNGTVKIGVTKEINDRIISLENETKLRVLDFKTTGYMPRSDALKLEAFLKEKYAPFCMGGEFFDVKFIDVCAEF